MTRAYNSWDKDVQVDDSSYQIRIGIPLKKKAIRTHVHVKHTQYE